MTEYLDLDGGIPLSLALDTNAFFPSMHSYPFFNSFAEIDGDLYAAGDLGIHCLSGATDNGAVIHSGVIWNKTDFGSSNQKRIRAFIMMGDIDDVVIQAESGGMSGVYSVVKNRAFVSRNLVGRDWSFRIADFDRLESIEIVPTILGR